MKAIIEDFIPFNICVNKFVVRSDPKSREERRGGRGEGEERRRRSLMKRSRSKHYHVHHLISICRACPRLSFWSGGRGRERFSSLFLSRSHSLSFSLTLSWVYYIVYPPIPPPSLVAITRIYFPLLEMELYLLRCYHLLRSILINGPPVRRLRSR